MTIERKVGMGIAGQPSGSENVAEVFSTDLFNIGNANLRIRNGIDLSGEGGMVWFASRGAAKSPNITDTERGAGYRLRPFSNYNANGSVATTEVVTQFRPDGFNYGDGYNSSTAVTWTFRKKEKFFDVVTWTGNDTAGRTIPHNLGSVPAMMIVKMTNGTYSWNVYHSGIGATKFLELDTNNGGQTSSAVWNNTAPTDSVFTVGQEYGVNQGSKTYVAYLFADNSSELANNQMIKCGSYSSVSGNQAINLGWEPQWILVKKTDGAEDWAIIDNMRGFSHTADDVSTTLNKALLANTSAAEENSGYAVVRPTSTGFIVRSGLDALYASSGSYIYMAIRAPMMKEPEAATEVFAMDLGTGSVPSFISGFPVDMAFNASYASASTHKIVGTRLTVGRYLDTTVNNAEANEGHNTFDFMNGWNKDSRGSAYLCWMWKRAKGYFDVVPYTGTGANHTVSHNLGAVPEMMWIKNRQRTRSWMVYHKDAGASKYFVLDTDAAAVTAGTTVFQQLTPTNTNFYVGSNQNANRYGDVHIAYLFATLDGISKVGTFVSGGSGVTVNVDCGFSNGARFVLIKALTTDSWYFWDTVRGIVAGNDSRLSLDNNNAVVTNQDNIDPYSAGFSLNGTLIGNSGNTFIFYAIA